MVRSGAVQMKTGVRDFDFWIGEWRVRNRRLVERLAGSDEWEEFDAEVVARFLMDGGANEDEFRTDHDGGFIGMSFRFFDQAAKRVGKAGDLRENAGDVRYLIPGTTVATTPTTTNRAATTPSTIGSLAD